jgi:hypothetical protein
MEARIISRPAARLASSARLTNPISHHGMTITRGHKTTARTKRSLNIAPHPSFIHPSSQAGFLGQDRIIFNPPAAEPSVHHTPFKFLPKSDPRRRANLHVLFGNGDATAATSEATLPPKLNVPSRNPSYHLTREDAEEIRRLRAEDPVKWSVNRLAEKFKCSEVFITICTPAPREHKERLQKRLEAVKSRWGPIRTKARQERVRRKDMLYRGEL